MYSRIIFTYVIVYVYLNTEPEFRKLHAIVSLQHIQYLMYIYAYV